MVECKMPEYKLSVFLHNPTELWAYAITRTSNAGSTIVKENYGDRYSGWAMVETIRDEYDFPDEETALQWGRRALWCLSLGD